MCQRLGFSFSVPENNHHCLSSMLLLKSDVASGGKIISFFIWKTALIYPRSTFVLATDKQVWVYAAALLFSALPNSEKGQKCQIPRLFLALKGSKIEIDLMIFLKVVSKCSCCENIKD